MAETEEISARNSVRRNMAYASMLLCIAITMCFLTALFDDGVAERVVKAWPPFTVFFPALVSYVGYYTHVGSRETRDLIAKEAK